MNHSLYYQLSDGALFDCESERTSYDENSAYVENLNQPMRVPINEMAGFGQYVVGAIISNKFRLWLQSSFDALTVKKQYANCQFSNIKQEWTTLCRKIINGWYFDELILSPYDYKLGSFIYTIEELGRYGNARGLKFNRFESSAKLEQSVRQEIQSTFDAFEKFTSTSTSQGITSCKIIIGDTNNFPYKNSPVTLYYFYIRRRPELLFIPWRRSQKFVFDYSLIELVLTSDVDKV